MAIYYFTAFNSIQLVIIVLIVINLLLSAAGKQRPQLSIIIAQNNSYTQNLNYIEIIIMFVCACKDNSEDAAHACSVKAKAFCSC